MNDKEAEEKTSEEVSEAEQQVQLRAALKDTFRDTLSEAPSHAWKEFGLCMKVKSEDAFEVFRALKENDSFAFNMLIDVTCVDWMDKREPRFDVVYQLLSLTHNTRLSIKIEVDEDTPEVPSVRELWASANFMEREAWDMYGVEFEGHGDLRRILMYDEFVGHPLRKDYPLRGKQPRVELRVPEMRNTSADMQKEQLVSLPTRRGRLG